MRRARDPIPTAAPEEDARGRTYNWRMLGAFWPFARPYSRTILLACGISVASAVLDLIGPYLVQQILDGPLRTGDTALLHRLVILWLAVHVTDAALNVALRLLVTWTGQSSLLNLRVTLFAHIQRLHQGFFDRHRVGRLLTRIMNDVAALDDLFAEGIPMFFRDLVVLAGIVTAMFLTDWRLACAVCVCFPLILAATWLFSRAIRVFYRLTRVRLAAVNGYLQEHLAGMATVQLFGGERRATAEFGTRNASLRDAHLGTVFVFALLFPAIELAAALGLSLILWRGGLRMIDGTLTFGVLTAFTLYLKRFFLPIRDLAEKFNTIESALAASERVLALMETRPEINDPPQPAPLGQRLDRIEFSHVWFAYEDERWVLEDVSFTVERGRKVAIVGATGAGKTSIVNALLRFYDIGRGCVRINGVDIRNAAQRDLRRMTALVLQDVHLFQGTLADNIRFGRPGLSDADVQRAAEAVHADGFIMRRPDGYAHRILESGSTLSAGEKQLLAFARALACDPQLLILDEATSNIDTETEAVIQDGLGHLLEGRTAIVIAHRLSTIRQADTILVMHQGRIREQGTHAELIARDGIYRRLCELQYGALPRS